MAEDKKKSCKCTTPEYRIKLNQQGPQGRQGSKGIPGFSPQVTVVQNTYDRYVLKITTVDGEMNTPNLKNPLPAGGQVGDVLVKMSDIDGDIAFRNLNDIFVSTTATQNNITGDKTFNSNITINGALTINEDYAVTENQLTNEINERTVKDEELQNQITNNHNDINELMVNLDATDTTLNGINEVLENLETNKQNKLIAGENISIDPETNIISSSESIDPSTVVTIADNQTITGVKTFENNTLKSNIYLAKNGTPMMYTNGTNTILGQQGNDISHYVRINSYQPLVRTVNGVDYKVYDVSNLILDTALETDTQEVRQGSDGKLYTAPGGGGGTLNVIDGGTAASVNASSPDSYAGNAIANNGYGVVDDILIT